MQDGFAMTHVFHRDLTAALPVITGAEGNYLIDSNGTRYLDACGGAAVSCLGHDHAKVREAIKVQVDKLAFAHTGSFTNQPAEDLADFLIAAAPTGTGEGRVMYLGSGSEAMEAALKLARQYHLERGETARAKVIARKPSYHGNTLGALATGGHAGRRAPFDPLLMDVSHIDAAYAYRLQHSGESEEDFALRMANLLQAEIERLGPETVMAFVAEPVVGASLGTQPAPKGYFRRIREICDTYGVLYIADEVMCGMGRTGTSAGTGRYRCRYHDDGQGAWCGLSADCRRDGRRKGGQCHRRWQRQALERPHLHEPRHRHRRRTGRTACDPG